MEKMTQETQPSIARMLGKYSAKVVAASPAKKLIAVGVVVALVAMGVAGLAATIKNSVPQRPAPKLRRDTLAIGNVALAPRSLKVIPFTVRHEGIVNLSVAVSQNGEVNLRVVDASEIENAKANFAAPLFTRGYRHYEAFHRNDLSTSDRHNPVTVSGGQLRKGDYCAIVVNENYLFSHDATIAVVEQYLR